MMAYDLQNQTVWTSSTSTSNGALSNSRGITFTERNAITFAATGRRITHPSWSGRLGVWFGYLNGNLYLSAAWRQRSGNTALMRQQRSWDVGTLQSTGTIRGSGQSLDAEIHFLYLNTSGTLRTESSDLVYPLPVPGRLYVRSDSPLRSIQVYEFDSSDGTIGNRLRALRSTVNGSMDITHLREVGCIWPRDLRIVDRRAYVLNARYTFSDRGTIPADFTAELFTFDLDTRQEVANSRITFPAGRYVDLIWVNRTHVLINIGNTSAGDQAWSLTTRQQDAAYFDTIPSALLSSDADYDGIMYRVRNGVYSPDGTRFAVFTGNIPVGDFATAARMSYRFGGYTPINSIAPAADVVDYFVRNNQFQIPVPSIGVTRYTTSSYLGRGVQLASANRVAWIAAAVATCDQEKLDNPSEADAIQTRCDQLVSQIRAIPTGTHTNSNRIAGIPYVFISPFPDTVHSPDFVGVAFAGPRRVYRLESSFDVILAYDINDDGTVARVP